jgi:mercuric reductase
LVSQANSSGNGKYDLVILGGGSGAFAAAIKASEMGARVAIVEEAVIGGTCLNRGCIPTKHLIRAAEIYHLAGHNPFPGITTKQGKVNLAKLIEKKESLIRWAQKAKYWDVLEHHKKVTFIPSRGTFVAPDRLKVNGGELLAPKFIIATGASPFIPPIEGIEKVHYLTSTEALELKKLPKSMIILGANAVGLEFAQMFQRIGTQVTIHEIAGRIAPGEEPEISEVLENYLKEEGIEICTCSRVIKAREERGKKVITAQMPNGSTKDFWGDEFLIATGRRPNTQGVGLDAIGVGLGARGGIKVNEKMQTMVPHIYAVGDCVDCDCPSQFVYVAAMQGAIAAHNALNEASPRKMDYTVVPHAIFTSPEVAGVGLKEDEAEKQGYRVKTSLLDFHWVPRAEVMLDERGLIKMVAEADTLRILGVHMVAHNAGDLIHEAALAIKYRLTANDLIDMLHVYPTLSEAIRICAQGFFKDVTKLSCCAE